MLWVFDERPSKIIMNRVRNWCFTLNNPGQDEIEYLQQQKSEWNYITWGEEVGENGTPHLQGYVEFRESLTMGQVKRRLGTDRIHLEPRRGSQNQAIEYCHKDGEIFEWGERTASKSNGRGEAAKNKALQFLPLIKAGKLVEIAEDPECTANIFRHVRDLAALLEAPRDVNDPPTVSWYYGETGTGKTRRAYYEAKQMGLGEPYVKSTASKWFDGYDGHEVVIFDDLRSSWFEYSYLLKLLDRYPTQVECKGGSRQWKAKRIFVTSPFPPEGMYEAMQERDKVDTIAQLVRRVHIKERMVMTPFGCWKEPIEERE